MDEKLKPCPFCGADDGHGVCVRCLWPYETYEVFCENCGASSKEFIRKEHAVEAWNKRVVKHGVWVRRSDNLECSECGYNACCNENSNYCPACGARMDKKE